MWIRFDENAAINMNQVEKLFFFPADEKSEERTLRAKLASGELGDLVTVRDRQKAINLMHHIQDALECNHKVCDIRAAQPREDKTAQVASETPIIVTLSLAKVKEIVREVLAECEAGNEKRGQ